jgi:hypothetical protein
MWNVKRQLAESIFVRFADRAATFVHEKTIALFAQLERSTGIRCSGYQNVSASHKYGMLPACLSGSAHFLTD